MDKKEDLKKGLSKTKNFLDEFKSFILKGNVMDMAIGVIIGTAFANIVSAFTTDFINPLINGIGGVNVGGRIKIYGGQYLEWGHFLTSVINFIIMALILFLMLKAFNKLLEVGKEKEVKEEIKEEVKKSDEVLLLEEIRDLLKKKK